MREQRITIVLACIVGISFLFLVKLFWVQVIDEHYKEEANLNSVNRIIVYPYRGVIKDRNGKLLVANTPIFDLMVIPKEVVIEDTNDFCTAFNVTKTELKEKMAAAITFSKTQPSLFVTQLSSEDFARMQDHLVDYPGFFVQQRSIRNYPYPSLAHALGYIGEISKEKIEMVGKNNYRPGDYIGISGIEQYYEQQLRGKRGVKYVIVDVKGNEKGAFRNGSFDTASVAGEDLTTGIDIELQQYAEKLLQGKKGSIVAIDPSTGEILCMASAPTYDPNLLTGKEFSKNFAALAADPDKPLYNKPVMALYPPGSTFKVVHALIGQQLRVIDSTTVFPCNRSYVNCHGGHAAADFHFAIQLSCNPYFYQVFRKIVHRQLSPNAFEDAALGYKTWRQYADKFGLGRRLGTDLLTEKSGRLATNEYFDKAYGKKRWVYETIYSISLGQGEVDLTPLQMANMACIIANRGYYYIPHLVKSIGKSNKPLKPYTVKQETGIDAAFFHPLITAMYDAVHHGTASHSAIPGIYWAGKTGTAQASRGDDHSLFLGFAPMDNPKIAIAVILENSGWGGSAAAPTASLIVEKYLNSKLHGTRNWVEEYVLKGVFPSSNTGAKLKTQVKKR